MPLVDTAIVQLVTVLYGFAVAGSGAFAYFTQGSKASLIASSICALVAMATSQLSWWGSCAFVALYLTSLFGQKLAAPANKKKSLASKAVSGSMAVFSLVEACLCLQAKF
eukprot:TRINITY_DN19754_c0_g1_i1.p1 TRINITY_DN19754_c0_g1~~TRINITY_DN19754_c0_g1_i1.p1  ORF type:complete len:128 (-),score=17.95 TRINITY_DN19754_c0_g1_i1:193-522(-)